MVIKRIDGANSIYPNCYALRIENDPADPAVIDKWVLHLPGHHNFWNHYLLLVITLADLPDCKPATKRFPEATHEFVIGALDPRIPAEELEKGERLHMLQPVNYVLQLQLKDDAEALALAEEAATGFVNAQVFGEPGGIQGAREMLGDLCQQWLSSREKQDGK